MKTKRKRFDCVAMKRRAAERIYRETAGLTREQEIEYWRRSIDVLKTRKVVTPETPRATR